MSKYLADYGSAPLYIKTGKGCYLYDIFGRKYIDFAAGWCVGNLGWKRKEIEEAIKKELDESVYAPAFLRWKKWEELAKLLCKHAPGRLRRAFRCTSGSEAVEFAIKCARASTKKTIIVSIDGVYHGHTYGAASVGDACRAGMGPCLVGFIKLPMPDEKNWRDVMAQFENLAKKNNVAAFMSEPVWTNAGILIPPKAFYPAIQKICRKYGTLFVMDEVATGFGRCGKLFASELWALKPDILCLGKGLTGGYGAAGATLTTEEVFQKSRGIPSYSTFGWVPTATAAMLANIKLVLKEKLWKKAQDVGDYLLEQLKELETLPAIKEVRGIGLLFGIEFRKPVALKILHKCGLKGLIMSEVNEFTLFLSPPLVLDKKTATEGAAILKKVVRGL